MNVLFLSETFFPHGSGAELATYLYANNLAKAGINVRVITNKFADDQVITKNENIIVYRIQLFEGMEKLKYSILKRVDVLLSSFMKKMVNWADVVYVPRYWFFAIPFVKALKKPVIFHAHDFVPVCPITSLFDLTKKRVCIRSHRGLLCQKCVFIHEKLRGRSSMEALASVVLNTTIANPLIDLFKLSDAVICVSKAQQAQILQRYPMARDKLRVIYNPIPDISYSNMEGDDFGYFGGPVYSKGFYTLCKAMNSIKNYDKGTPTVHITNFPNKSKNPQFTYLGFLPHIRLNTFEFEMLYKQIRCVIIPSLWVEPWGYVLSEALLRGRLAIASRSGGLIEQAEGCKGVLLFDTNDVAQLAESISYFSSLSKERAIDLGFQNRAVFAKKYDNAMSTRNFIKVCEFVAKNS